jgi:hypothetical protein
MTLAGLLADVIGLLDQAGVPYMVTGSVASSFHGEPRATRDLDIVIDPGRETLEHLVDGLMSAGFYVDRDTALEALRTRTQFNAIAVDAGKVDFILRRDRPFSIEEFGRRRPADLLGTQAFVASVEDTIIAKLEWAATTESERQLRDVEGMLAIGGDLLDRGYVERWVHALGLEPVWAEVTQRETQ